MRFKSQQKTSSTSNADFLRRHARNLLRDVRSDHPSKSLPIIRRVHSAGIAPTRRLPDLYHTRESLQLKHMLRTVAVELGYATWDACKRNVDRQPPSVLDRFRLDLGGFGDYNQIWFSNESAAQEWQREHGGHVVIYGSQAVVMTV
jgi:hypothetical protein